MKSLKYVLLPLFIWMSCSDLFAISFKEAIKKIENHDLINSLKQAEESLLSESRGNSSWGDPKLKIAAKNFPKNDLNKNKSPMTGIDFSLSQKISLSNKYSKLGNIKESLSKAKGHEAYYYQEKMKLELWILLITKRKLIADIKIQKDGFNWINKMLKISKKLYSNGKASMQGTLDLQVRKTQSQIILGNKEYEIKILEEKISYLLGTTQKITTIPWSLINNKSIKNKDYKELEMIEKVNASEFAVNSGRLNYIPDINISVNYTKRSDMDGHGDFVGASISFPLPFSSKVSSDYKKNINNRKSMKSKMNNYHIQKTMNKNTLILKIQKNQFELNIIKKKTLAYSKHSRDITAKSYGHGNTSYLELLQSELNLESILLKEVKLQNEKDINKMKLKFITGDLLNEE